VLTSQEESLSCPEFSPSGQVLDDEAQPVRTTFELPEISAWAGVRLSDYSEGEIHWVVQEWRSAPRPCTEPYWLEGALARQRARASD
jgi:hypothetical protein